MRLYKPLWLVLIYSIIACSPKRENQSIETSQPNVDPVSIKGQVQNPQDGLVILYQIKENQKFPTDTLALDDSGEFEAKVAIDHTGFYLINFYEQQEKMLVLNPGDKIEVTADGSEAEGFFEIKNSPDTELLNEYLALDQELSNQMNVQREEYTSAENKIEAGEAYNAFVKEAVNRIKAFIDKTDNSIVAVFPISQLNMDEDLDYITPLAQKLYEKYPEEGMVANLKNKVEAIKSTAVGRVAPEISLNNPEGKEVSLSSLRGKYVLIDFWASWCGPCRQENPNVVRLYNKYKDKGFEIYGVSLDRDESAWQRAIEKDGLEWVHVSDLNFWNSEVVPLYNIEGIPMTVLIDKEGKIVAKNLRGPSLEAKLEEIL